MPRSTQKIVFADRHLLLISNELDLERWKSLGASYVEATCESEQDITDICGDAHVVVFVGNDLPLNARVLSRLEECRLILRVGAGFDSVDVEAATQMGIVVANCAGYCNEDVAMHALTLLLACSRQIPLRQLDVIEGRWSHMELEHTTERLSEMAVGIVGLGRIGGTLAKMLGPLVNQLLAYDPYISDDAAAVSGAQRVSFDELLEQSDVVSLHVPLNKETRRLIGRRELNLMKPNAYLINTARGPVVDQSALYDALVNKQLAGAGLDVLEIEPPSLPLHELFHLPNVIVTGHIAPSTPGARRDVWRIASENVAGLLNGDFPETAVNPDVQPRVPLKKGGAPLFDQGAQT